MCFKIRDWFVEISVIGISSVHLTVSDTAVLRPFEIYFQVANWTNTQCATRKYFRGGSTGLESTANTIRSSVNAKWSRYLDKRKYFHLLVNTSTATDPKDVQICDICIQFIIMNHYHATLTRSFQLCSYLDLINKMWVNTVLIQCAWTRDEKQSDSSQLRYLFCFSNSKHVVWNFCDGKLSERISVYFFFIGIRTIYSFQAR